MRRFLTTALHPSWCFYALVWGVIAGIIISQVLECDFGIPPLIAITMLIGLLFFWPKACRIIIIASFLVGLVAGNCYVSPQLESKIAVSQYVGKTVTIIGNLSEDASNKNGKISVKLQKLQLQFSNEAAIPLTGTFYATISGTAPELERSDTLQVTGKLSAGFGTFVGSMTRAKITSIDRSETGDIFGRFKKWFATIVRAWIPSPKVDLGLGYLMGMKSGLPEDFATALQLVGMTHVVVASGAHLAILTGAAKKIFGKISRFAGMLFALMMILFFVLIVGFTPSMTRAALVASLSLLMDYIGRKFTPIRLISFVAMLTLLIEPTNFFNLGWQLSFASFFGILVMGPRLQKAFYGGKTPPWLASMLITSIATSLVCAPILIYNFGTISFLSLIANLIILPTLPYAMLGMVLTGVTSFIAPLAHLVAMITVSILDLHIWVVNFLSEQKAFILELPSANAYFYLLYLPVLLFLCYPSIRQAWRRFRPQANSPALAEAEESPP